jgi:transcriptional regulator with XRE-family HTH domain
MKLSQILDRELSKRKFKTVAEAAHVLDVSAVLLRQILNGSHIPREKILIKIAERLGIEASELIFAAHKHSLPPDAQAYLLKPSDASKEHRRIWPLSQEQCDYLAQQMSPQEIQLIRKYRQFDYLDKARTLGYVDYKFSTQRVPPPPSAEESPSPEDVAPEAEASEPLRTEIPDSRPAPPFQRHLAIHH